MKANYLLETTKYGLLFKRIELEEALKMNWGKLKKDGWKIKFTIPPYYMEIYQWVKKPNHKYYKKERDEIDFPVLQ